jgi:hypothetical protein
MSEISIKLGLDSSGFTKGVQMAKQALGALASVGTVAAAFRGMYAAMEAGGALVDLSSQTGVAIDKLMVLRMAFEQAGLGADAVQPAIAKLQKTIASASVGNAEAVNKFRMLGMSVGEIQNLAPDEQFQKIGEAVSNIQDPSQRAAVAMEFFGKSGAKLLSVFSAGGMEDIAQNIGGQAKLMLENAGYFDRITDVLGTAGSKLQGLFVGMASQIVPPILFAVEQLNKMDLSNLGLSLGSGLKAATDTFEWWFDNFAVAGGDTLWTSMKLQGAMWINEMANGIRYLFGGKMTELIDTQPLIDKLQANQDAIQSKGIERDQVKTSLMDKYKFSQPEFDPSKYSGGLLPTETKFDIGSQLSSLQKVGGASGGIGGGIVQDQLGYQTLRIQTDIRDYMRDMLNVLKGGEQDYNLTVSPGLVLNA